MPLLKNVLALLVFAGFIFGFQPTLRAHDPAKDMLDAADLLLKSLDADQKKQISFEFDDKLRKNWQFIPMEREGLNLKEMKVHQRHLAMSLVQSALSHRGFSTTMKIMALEQVLHEMENFAPKRDPSKYHFFFFGTPSSDKTWGWRIEGHHLSISFTIVEGKTVVTTPAFFGSNPGEVRQGTNMLGLRVLGEEEELGRSLVKQLTVKQKAVAILPEKAPRDVINGPKVPVASALEPAGIAVSEMTNDQKVILKKLISTYVGKFRVELADADWKKINEAGFEKVHFAWAGPIQPGKPHYYRVQGPTFILEYDNTQNKANHVHAVWRDFKNDFGEDLLRKHYEAVPHKNSN
jgi:hypothetical protein